MKKREKVQYAVAAALALAGFVLITVRLWGMRFSGFLLLGTALALALSALLERLADRGGGWAFVRKGFYFCISIVLTILCCIEIFVINRGNSDLRALPADAVIVLGAGVNGSQPSLSLQTRLETALDYLEYRCPEGPVVLTGGQGYGEEITEARCMYNWLTERGVNPDRLILEEQAANTAENFSFSKILLEEEGIDPAADRVAVVTNDFHIARAELIAEEKTGYGAVIGIPAKLPWIHLTVNYYLREAFAVVKTVLFD